MSWQLENFLDVRDNHLHIDGVDAVALAREHGTPLFVYSESRIRHNIERLRKSASVIDCPLKICYASNASSGIMPNFDDSSAVCKPECVPVSISGTRRRLTLARLSRRFAVSSIKFSSYIESTWIA